MTLVLDAAPLVALADAKEPQLEALLRIRDEEEGQTRQKDTIRPAARLGEPTTHAPIRAMPGSVRADA